MPENTNHAAGVGSDDAGLSEAGTIPAGDLALAAEALAGLLPDGLCIGANGAVRHDGSGSACVDLFSQVNPSTDEPSFNGLVSASWALDPTTTLRLVFHMGNCRRDGGGKLDRLNFMRGLLWMWRNGHRAAVLGCLEEIPRQGCYKGLLTLVHEAIFCPGYTERNNAAIAARSKRVAAKSTMGKLRRAVEREASRSAVKREFAASLGVPLAGVWIADPGSLLGGLDTSRLAGSMSAARKAHGYRPNAGRWVDEATRERFHAFCRERELRLAESHRAERAMRSAAVMERRLAMSADESLLYSRVVALFAEGIAREHARAEAGPAWHPPMHPWMPEAPASPACKWAPTPGNMHDRETMLAGAIAGHPLVAAILESGAVGGGPAMHRFARLLSSVRSRSGVPESFVGPGRWRLVNYGVMPSVCRQQHGDSVYRRHDRTRYEWFLHECAEAMRSGGAGGPRVHAGCVLPHHVTASALADAASIQPDLQWAEIVTRLKSARDARRVLCGREPHVVPICDVSGSMDGEPMDVAVAISLLLAESARRGSPEFGRMLPFSSEPSVVEIKGIPDYDTGEGIEAGGLARRIEQVMAMEWGESTNLEAAMELVLGMCLRNGVGDAQARGIVLLVLSDMEFDQCRGRGAVPWETTHEAISRRWRDSGYSSPPKIVYWNLRGSDAGRHRASPVMSTQPGAACVSGFSPSILEAILDGAIFDDGGFTPEAIMGLALDRPCYLRLAVRG